MVLPIAPIVSLIIGMSSIGYVVYEYVRHDAWRKSKINALDHDDHDYTRRCIPNTPEELELLRKMETGSIHYTIEDVIERVVCKS